MAVAAAELVLCFVLRAAEEAKTT